MGGFTKLREDHEARYVSEYVLQKYPHDEVKYRCPLGMVPEQFIAALGLGKAVRMYRPYRPECDAAVITDNEIVLIEGKIFKVVDGLAKLPLYRFLVPQTPEFSPFKSLPVRALLVTPKRLTWGEDYAREAKVSVDYFMPAWIAEYYERQERYWTGEERFKRYKRGEILKRLGYEK